MRPATFWFSVLFQTFEYDCVDLSLFFFLFVQLLAKTLLLGKKKEDEGDAATFCVSRPVGLACGSNLLSHFGFLSSFLCTIDIIWCFGFMTYRPTGATSLFSSWIFFVIVFFWFLFDLARGQERGVHHRLSAWQHWLFAEFVWFCSWRRIDWPAASGGCGWGLLFVCCLSALKKGKQIFYSEKAVHSWV